MTPHETNKGINRRVFLAFFCHDNNNKMGRIPISSFLPPTALLSGLFTLCNALSSWLVMYACRPVCLVYLNFVWQQTICLIVNVNLWRVSGVFVCSNSERSQSLYWKIIHKNKIIIIVIVMIWWANSLTTLLWASVVSFCSQCCVPRFVPQSNHSKWLSTIQLGC